MVSSWPISEADWSNWEMHPNGDEFVYLLSGSIDLLIDVMGFWWLGSIASLGPLSVIYNHRNHLRRSMLYASIFSIS